jgi:hypothetical protein
VLSSDILVQFLRVPNAVLREFRVKCISHLQLLNQSDPDLTIPNDLDAVIDNVSLPNSPSKSSASPVLQRMPSTPVMAAVRSPLSRFASDRSQSRSGVESSISNESIGVSMTPNISAADKSGVCHRVSLKHKSLLLLVSLVVVYFTVLYWTSFGVAQASLQATPSEVP